MSSAPAPTASRVASDRASNPAAECIHTLFESQAARTPGAPALSWRGETLAYAALNARANRLAHRLRALNVRAETRVAVFLPRTPDLVIALLGVLKAGGAYVPVDPAYPAARVAAILDDADAALVITAGSVADRLPRSSARVLQLDAEEGAVEACPATDPGPLAHPENLAYVIHTSGSTGRPKGVAIEHRNTAAVLRWMRDAISDEERACVLASTSVCFDVSIAEIFGTLCWGGRIVLVDDVLALPAVDEEVRLICVVPSAAAELVRAGGIPPSVRTLALGGEAVPPALAREIHHRTGVRRVLNLYGPTEDTTYSTCAVLLPDATGAVAIGRPVAGSEVRVLDAALRPVPSGAEGELYMAGAGVSRGYLGRPGATAERWLPDPGSETPGARMYRSGDLGRLRPDGQLECLGRIDHQVKIRGFRVETGEVESTLLEHPAVAATAVVARDDAAGGRRLVAYVVAAEGGDPSAEALRTHVRDRLPEYMVPAAVVAMQALPRTPNGKVDRRALPEPPAPVASFAGHLAPRTETETALAAIWAAVLGVEPVGLRDDFYELGGHSLSALQISARIREALDVELPIGEMFDLPTVEGQARAVERKRAARSGADTRIPRADRDAPLPLSFAQEAVWFFERLSPGMRSYQFQATVRFRGVLDDDALRRALAEIVRRHEIFRTTFPEVDGAPVQRIHAPWTPALRVEDLRSVPADARDAELARRFAAQFEGPFRIDTLPLVRWTLYRTADDEHVLLAVEHHVVHDGWSFGVFLRELAALYTAFAAGEPSPLPEPEIQFADYAAWQRAWMRTDEARAQVDFWRRHLHGAPPALELPADRPRPPRLTFRGNSLHLLLPRGVAAAADAFSRRHGVTLYMTLLAAFQALVHRYTGRRDFVLGGGAAGRRMRELEETIGMIVNVVPLRADLAGEPDFLTLLERVRGEALQAYAHQDVPFGEIVEALQPVRSMERLPIFQVAFNAHHAPYPDLRLPGVTLEVTEALGNQTSKFDLQVIAIPRAQQNAAAADEVVLIWEYATDLFDRQTVERMARHYATLLDALIHAPDRPVARARMLDDGERERLLHGWNGPAVDYPRDATVHGVFAEVVARAPGALAVEYGTTHLTYGELDAAGDRAARRLRALGVGPETTVALALRRSAEAVAAMLGVLKAGGAYLPLDPEHPAARRTWMMTDAGAAVLVLDDPASAPEDFEGAVVTPGALIDRAGAVDDAELPPVHAESLAAVIYTSGSTGTPKGIGITHRGIVRLVRGPADAPDEAARVTQIANLSFDAATWEIWSALLNGARLVGIDREDSLAPAVLAARLKETGATHVFLTTALFNQMAREAPDAFRGLRWLGTGGEACDAGAMRRALEDGRPRRLVHAYGPAESTTYATTHTASAVPPDAATVPIGRAVPNTTVYALDAHGEPVPPGVVGELYVGGDGLARGYLGRPALTAERFVPDGCSGRAGARLYRTGDRVRWLPEGVLEFAGRADAQVKIRGFRVEPAEIEAALRTHPDVGDAAVAVRESAPGERSLVAYVVPGSGVAPDAAAMREHLGARLPRYMLPSAYVLLHAIPLTPNGKVDRGALPDPTHATLAVDFVPPSTADEEAIAAVWRELLGADRVGADDDFFGLGGHSLVAVRAVDGVARALGVELPVSALFEAPTVRALAARVAAARQALLRDRIDWLESLTEAEVEALLQQE
jgi:amino acid adenylation domain-containing protein